MARKMALIPAEMANNSNSTAFHTPSGPTLNQMSRLDQQMKAVLEDSSVSPEMKLQQYYSTLRRYDTLQENATHIPVPVQIQEKPPPMQTSPVTGVVSLPVEESEILDQVPKTQKQNARLLLNYVKENPQLSWNKNKEMVHNGVVVKGSNIFDLVSDFTRNRKNQPPAQGWRQFTNALITQNIPRGAVGNNQRWQYIRNQQQQEPPIEEEEEEDDMSFQTLARTPAYSPSPSAIGQHRLSSSASASSYVTPVKRRRRSSRNKKRVGLVYDSMYDNEDD